MSCVPSHVQERPPGVARLGGGGGGALQTACSVSPGGVVWGPGGPLCACLWVTRGPCHFTIPAPHPEGDCHTLRGPVCTLLIPKLLPVCSPCLPWGRRMWTQQAWLGRLGAGAEAIPQGIFDKCNASKHLHPRLPRRQPLPSIPVLLFPAHWKWGGGWLAGAAGLQRGVRLP